MLKVLVNISDPKKIVEKPDEKEQGYDPMRRAPYMFGGVIRDWKKRFPLKVYWSDIKDGLDGQVFAAAIFIFFACLSGAIGKSVATIIIFLNYFYSINDSSVG